MKNEKLSFKLTFIQNDPATLEEPTFWHFQHFTSTIWTALGVGGLDADYSSMRQCLSPDFTLRHTHFAWQHHTAVWLPAINHMVWTSRCFQFWDHSCLWSHNQTHVIKTCILQKVITWQKYTNHTIPSNILMGPDTVFFWRVNGA